MENKRNLRIAIQKSGRLKESSFDLLKSCGLKIAENKNQLLCRVQNMPIDILLARDDDIPTFISEGVCDLGIVGENVFTEDSLSVGSKLNAKIKKYLGFSKCRLSIAVPQKMEDCSLENLDGLKIATSYPFILKDFLNKKNINAEIVKMEGSVEVAPYFKISDIICDLVSSGATLEANNLVEKKIILESQAVLIERKNASITEEKQKIIDKLVKRIEGVIAAKESKYVMLNSPKDKIDEITALIPGADAPTVMTLKDPQKVAIHAICYEPIFWETLEKLKKAGATSILVMPIEKMME